MPAFFFSIMWNKLLLLVLRTWVNIDKCVHLNNKQLHLD